MNTISQLRPDHWAWLHAKFAMILWAFAFFFYTPLKVETVVGFIIASLIALVVVIGISISVFGLLRSISDFTEKARQGINIELAGLWIAISGPISYFVIQLFLSFGPEGDQRIALTVLAYAIFAFMLVRIVMVREFRKRTNA